MTFQYDEIVPWGRSFDEYCRMFALGEEELKLRIVGCGDGPAAFNAELARRGGRVVSCDPLYERSAADIEDRIRAGYDTVIAQTRKNRDNFLWDRIGSVDDLGRARMDAMRIFLGDFEAGKKAGRYLAAELPGLPFPDSSFDLALCSHFLFLYSDMLPLEFHLQSVIEMCRVAREARIFPLLDYNSQRSEHLGPLTEKLPARGLAVEIVRVNYEFQRGANEMMRVRALNQD